MNPGISIRLGNNATHKTGERAFYRIIPNLEQSGDVMFPAATNAIRLVEEVFAIAERFLRILVLHGRGAQTLLKNNAVERGIVTEGRARMAAPRRHL
jgi:hypothetical protein